MKKRFTPTSEPVGEELSNETLDKVRGGTTRPQPDDEVLVSFENGDIKAPVIVGGLWNGKPKP